MRETYAPILLEYKAAQLSKSTRNFYLQVETASSTPVSAVELLWKTVTRTSKMILFSPSILSLGILYSLLMLVTFTQY